MENPLNASTLSVALGREEAAMCHFREILRIDPDNTDAHSNLANVLRAGCEPAHPRSPYDYHSSTSPLTTPATRS